MLLRQLFDPVSSTYTYLLADSDTGEAVLIDSVFEQHDRDAALIRELGVTLRYTLDTHCHADHVTGAWLMKQSTGSDIVLASACGAENVDVGVKGGDVIGFGGCSLEVRATPGHTSGCVTYVSSDHRAAFTGDCLLIRGCGRTDFQQGDAHQLYQSIVEHIFTLPDDCLLYPGHDYQGRTVTSVAEEKAHNQRLGGGATEEDFVGFMDNMKLPHPKQISVAVPANMRCGRPEPSQQRDVPAWGPVVVTYAGTSEIDPVWVARHRDRVLIVDVRAPGELTRELGAIDGAVNIPLDELRDRTGEIPRDRPVVTVCHSGRRSALAAQLLYKAGIERVANLAGGMLRWRELAYPLS